MAASRRVVVVGRVQGVGYREWTRRTASRLGVSGWVRNRRDGSVEALLSGEASAIERMLEAMRAGPPAACVDGLTSEPSDGDGRIGFDILPTH
ncbi:acylphosphatase [Prosthecomicrobium sp. N25]|uniref:acylphosphatase n=1 Tax=Prosthecomicrobium sp. N25 TaxID=3129254 RepID=UPI00307746EF